MKGQAFVDTVVLFMLVSTILVTMYVYTGNRSVEFQRARYSASQHQAGLEAMLDYYFDLGSTRGYLKDLLVTYACQANSGNSWVFYTLLGKLKEKLNLINSNSYKDLYYIFYIEINRTDGFRISGSAYNKWPTVCISDISVARWDASGTCANGEKYSVKIEYGTWHKWEKVSPTC